MFATEHFVFMHLPKTAGVYVESVCQENLRMPILHSRRHAGADSLPAEFAGLPKVGVVRDPWDWYASLYYFAKSERNTATSDLVALASNDFDLGFEATLGRLLLPDLAFVEAYEQRMKSLGGFVSDFECLDVDTMRSIREGELGLLGFLASKIFSERLDHVWRYETLRQDMFSFLSPLCPDRSRFRSAMVSPPRNVSGKPSLPLLYSAHSARMVEQREAIWIAKHGYASPVVGVHHE